MQNTRVIGWVKYRDGEPITKITVKDGVIENDEETFNHWKHCLNSPWMGTCYGYNISLNSSKDQPGKFICEYSVVVFDSLEVGLFGFGETPNEALSNCEKLLFEYTQDGSACDSAQSESENIDIVPDMARQMCASRGCGLNPPKDCRECDQNMCCIYQELAAQIKNYYPQSKIDEMQDWINGYRATIASMEKIDEELRADADRYRRYYFNHEYDKIIAESELTTAKKIFADIEDAVGKSLHVDDHMETYGQDSYISCRTLAKIKEKYKVD